MWRLGAAGTLLLVAAAACTNGDDGAKPNPAVPTTVDIFPDSVLLTYINEGKPFRATVYDQNGSLMSAPVSWSVSDTSVLTVAGDSVRDRDRGCERHREGLAAAGEAVDTVTVLDRDRGCERHREGAGRRFGRRDPGWRSCRATTRRGCRARRCPSRSS